MQVECPYHPLCSANTFIINFFSAGSRDVRGTVTELNYLEEDKCKKEGSLESMFYEKQRKEIRFFLRI